MKLIIQIILLLLQFLNGFTIEIDNCVGGRMNFYTPSRLEDDLDKILNGTEVRPNKYPWMVSLQMNYDGKWGHLCSGSIISDKTILSAAHCIDGLELFSFRVLVEISEYSSIAKPMDEQIYYPVAMMKHPKFFRTKDKIPINDVLMIVVNRQIKFNSFVNPICLPSHNDDKFFWNYKATVLGWRKVNFENAEEKFHKITLTEKNVFLRSSKNCTLLLQPPKQANFYETLMCSFGYTTENCREGSESLLFANYKINHHVVIGVGTFISNECDEEFSSVFTRVSSPSVLNWINKTIELVDGNVCRHPTQPEQILE